MCVYKGVHWKYVLFQKNVLKKFKKFKTMFCIQGSMLGIAEEHVCKNKINKYVYVKKKSKYINQVIIHVSMYICAKKKFKKIQITCVAIQSDPSSSRPTKPSNMVQFSQQTLTKPIAQDKTV